MSNYEGSNPFGAKNVPAAVRSELTARSTNKGPIWAAQRFPWVHLSSFASSCGGEYSQLSSKLDTDPGTRYEMPYKRTKPVITQVQVKKQGELGTTRSCTVNLKAFTDDQLIALQKCYFISGMTVRVQFGWSLSCNGTGPASPITGPMDDGMAICRMQSQAAGNPGYDGLQGLVTNFGYKLTSDGYWECNLEIVAASESVGDGKVAVMGEDCGCSRVFKSQDDEDVTAKRSLLYTWLFDINSQAQAEEDCVYLGNQVGEGLVGSSGGWIVSAASYEGEDRNDSGGSAQNSLNPNYDAHEGYISWRTLEAAINVFAIPTAGGKHTIGRVQSSNLYVPSHYWLDSGDPRICVLPGSPRLNAAIDAGDFVWDQNDPGDKWDSWEIEFGGTIMLNCIFLMQELKAVEDGDNKISTFLRNVLKKVNNTCGGYWDGMLEIVSTTEDCLNPNSVPTVSLIDIRKYEPGSTFMVPSLANNSVIRDLKLDMKLTGAMKSQALYANGSKQNGKQTKCQSVPFRAFGIGASVTDLARPKAETPPPCKCKDAPSSVDSEEKGLGEIFEEMFSVVDNSTTSAAISAVTDKINGDDDTEQKCKGMILPFDFGFTVDGIGGFAFGQIVSSDRIPPNVRSGFDFQITAVEHSISAQDWTTTVNTVARYKKKL